jgi:putative Holliday junction resolvase
VPHGAPDAEGWRRGARLGVDVGDVRVGTAVSDPDGLLATPVETVARGQGDLARIAELAREHDVVEIVVGLPRSLSGGEGPAAAKARAFAVELAETLVKAGIPDVPVRLLDERLTTVSAERVLRERGRKGARRREVVDQAAAVVILQHAIDTERSTGRPPGQEVGSA